MATYLNTPNFFISINGMNYTPFCTGWQLDDVEDGMSSLRITLGNPDGKLAGYFTTETYVTFRYGYWNGSMSKPIVMRVKDMDESYETSGPPLIDLMSYDVTERLIGVTHAGNSSKDAKPSSMVESIIEGIKAKAEVLLSGAEKMPERIPLHNMTSHAAIRWLMGQTRCKKETVSNVIDGGNRFVDDYPEDAPDYQGNIAGESNLEVGSTPIGSQDGYTAGKEFRAAESFTGDRTGEAQINRDFNHIDKLRVINRRNKAGNQVITGRLDLVGLAGIEAKKCITVLNAGPQGSGKWYVTKSSQRYDKGAPFTATLNLMRPSLDSKGKPTTQPIVMYAKIYEPNVIFVGCREVDGPSQITVSYGQRNPGGELLVRRFKWGIRVVRSRSAGEGVKTKTWAINQAKKLLRAEAIANGTYRSSTPPAPPSDKVD